MLHWLNVMGTAPSLSSERKKWKMTFLVFIFPDSGESGGLIVRAEDPEGLLFLATSRGLTTNDGGIEGLPFSEGFLEGSATGGHRVAFFLVAAFFSFGRNMWAYVARLACLVDCRVAIGEESVPVQTTSRLDEREVAGYAIVGVASSVLGMLGRCLFG